MGGRDVVIPCYEARTILIKSCRLRGGEQLLTLLCQECGSERMLGSELSKLSDVRS